MPWIFLYPLFWRSLGSVAVTGCTASIGSSARRVDRFRHPQDHCSRDLVPVAGLLKKPSENFHCRYGNRILDDYEHDNDNGQGLRPSFLVPALPG